MFGISAPEFIVLLAVAAVVLGPERMPQYAAQLGRLVRELRKMAQGASAQVRNEMGPEFDDIDWRKFDPRQYDPRRIVRDALADTFDPDDPLGLRELREDKPVSEGGPWARDDDPVRDDPAEGNGADPAGRLSRNPDGVADRNGLADGVGQVEGTGRPDGAAQPERIPDRSAPPPFDTDAT